MLAGCLTNPGEGAAFVLGYPLHRENRVGGGGDPSQGKCREFGNFAKTQEKHRDFGLLNCKFPDS